MLKNLTVFILLLFQAAWSVQILGTREFGTECHLELRYVPASEKIGALKITIRIAPDVDASSVMTDAPSDGAWSQIKPALSRNGNLIELVCVGPALKRSRLTDTIGMCRISFELSGQPVEKPLFNGIIDSIWFSECLDIQGEKTAPLLNTEVVSVQQMHRTTSQRTSVEYRGIGRVHSLSFLLTEREHVKAWVVDARGRLVSKLTDSKLGPGLHTVRWPDNGRQIPSGTYFIQLEIRNYTYNKKVSHYR